MAETDHRLESLLTLEQIDRDIFRSPTDPQFGGPGRLFGGQVCAQALRAALGTVDVDHRVHSLHSYFLRPGQRDSRVVYMVDRIRDGRSFTTRRVVAVQGGEAIFNLSASFHKVEPGPEYQRPSDQDVPDPETLPTDDNPWLSTNRPIDAREVRAISHDDPDGFVRRVTWIRATGELPDDPGLHACVLAFVSDMGPVGVSRGAQRHAGAGADTQMMGASLDHTMWFHHEVRADEWLLYSLEAVATSNARGLARGAMHTRDGKLAVSITQEALLRPVRHRA